MQLSTLQSETRRLLGGLTATDYASADITLALNRWLHVAITNAILSNGSWEVNGEVATANIVAGQKEYTFPSDLVALKRIEANMTGGTDSWRWATIRDLRQNILPLSNSTTSGIGSLNVDVYDASIFFADSPSTNVTGGLKVYYQKEPTELSGATDEPLLPEFSHIGLSYGACFDFCLARPGLETRAKYFENLTKEFLDLKIREYYANRLPAERPRVKARRERYN